MLTKDLLINAPDSPGVYFFWKDDLILYIGKATNLKDRTKSYLSKDLIETRGLKIFKMTEMVNKVTFEATDSVLEALILESNLIKKYKPIYNTRDKDDKSHYYIAVTKETFPAVFVTRGRDILKANLFDNLPNVDLFGPFPNGNILRDALRILRKIFPFRDLKSDKKYYNEFYKQLKLSPSLENSPEISSYQQRIKDLKNFLRGNKKGLILELEKRMFNFSKKQLFEDANKVKKTLYALKHIQDISLIKDDLVEKKGKIERIEAFDIAHLAGKNTVGVMVVFTDGEKDLGQYRKFKVKVDSAGNDLIALEEILERRFSHRDWKLPTLIVGDGGLAQKKTIEKVLKNHNLKIPIVMVVKNEKHNPEKIIGPEKLVTDNKNVILQINQEAHRFAIEYYRMLQRGKIRF